MMLRGSYNPDFNMMTKIHFGYDFNTKWKTKQGTIWKGFGYKKNTQRENNRAKTTPRKAKKEEGGEDEEEETDEKKQGRRKNRRSNVSLGLVNRNN